MITRDYGNGDDFGALGLYQMFGLVLDATLAPPDRVSLLHGIFNIGRKTPIQEDGPVTDSVRDILKGMQAYVRGGRSSWNAQNAPQGALFLIQLKSTTDAASVAQEVALATNHPVATEVARLAILRAVKVYNLAYEIGTPVQVDVLAALQELVFARDIDDDVIDGRVVVRELEADDDDADELVFVEHVDQNAIVAQAGNALVVHPGFQITQAEWQAVQEQLAGLTELQEQLGVALKRLAILETYLSRGHSPDQAGDNDDEED